MWWQPSSAVQRASPACLLPIMPPRNVCVPIGISQDKSVHNLVGVGRELETEHGRTTGAHVYPAVDDGDAEQEIAIRLPKEIAIQILTIPSANPAEDMARVI